MKFESLNAKIATLELALDKIIASFTRFHNIAIENYALPPDIASALGRTSLNIASIAMKARSGEHFSGIVPHNINSDITLDSQEAGLNTAEPLGLPKNRVAATEPNHINQNSMTVPMQYRDPPTLVIQRPPVSTSSTSRQQDPATLTTEVEQRTWFPAQLSSLCLDRALKILTSPNMTYDELHPAVSIHLNSVTIGELLQAMIYSTARSQAVPQSSITLTHPTMFRTIEGSDDLLLDRLPDSAPQQLIHGRTRTKLGTNQQDFQGEWLEPTDVQEYLEWKGIFLGDSEPGQILQITLPKSMLIDIWTQDATAIFIEEIQRSRLMLNMRPVDIEPRSTNFELLKQITPPVPYQARQNDPPISAFLDQPMAAYTSKESPIQVVTAQYNQGDESYQSGYAEKLVDIALDLDRMMKYLVEAACCIGPGPGIRLEAVEHALRISIAVHQETA